MIKKILILGIVALIFITFRTFIVTNENAVGKAVEMTPLSLLKKHGQGTHKVKDLHGKNEAELVSLLGDFTSKQVINPSKGLLEYQVELHNKFQKQNVEIIELQWIEASEKEEASLVIWLTVEGEESRAFDTLLFNRKEIEF